MQNNFELTVLRVLDGKLGNYGIISSGDYSNDYLISGRTIRCEFYVIDKKDNSLVALIDAKNIQYQSLCDDKHPSKVQSNHLHQMHSYLRYYYAGKPLCGIFVVPVFGTQQICETTRLTQNQKISISLIGYHHSYSQGLIDDIIDVINGR